MQSLEKDFHVGAPSSFDRDFTCGPLSKYVKSHKNLKTFGVGLSNKKHIQFFNVEKNCMTNHYMTLNNCNNVIDNFKLM